MAIYIDEKNKQFMLSGKSFTYVFDVRYGVLRHGYYGKKLADGADLTCLLGEVKEGFMADMFYGGKRVNCSADTIMQECPTFGTGDYRSLSLVVRGVEGGSVVHLVYKGYEIIDELPKPVGMPSFSGGQTLAVTLTDEVVGVEVKLFYTVNEEFDTLLRRTEIVNTGKSAVYIDKAASFCVDFADKDLNMLTFYGRHAQERQVEESEITHNRAEIESSRGISSHQKNPFVILKDRYATETQGEAYGFSLCYSGNYSFSVEKDSFSQIRIDGGINERTFSWELKENEAFQTPQAILCYSDCGLGGLSRNLHDMARNFLIGEKAFMPRPVVVNSWEAMYFDLDEKKLVDFVNRSGGVGVDTFVLDDGWFGKRDDDTTSLGDWYVDKRKLPNGLKPIIDACHRNGLKFGLWFEPEMISFDSELYRAHPDYAVQVKGRSPVLSRLQYNLDMTRKDVIEYLKQTIGKVLSENEIDFVKWDMNRDIVENHSSRLLGAREKEFCHRYVLGVYELADYFTKKFPNIFFEGCSGGGGRFDFGMLAYFPQIWTSDNTDADERTRIQYGTSFLYPLSAISSHVSKIPNGETNRLTKMETRGDVATCGALGYELDFAKMDKEDYAQILPQVNRYRKYQDVILSGDIYRLASPFDTNFFGMEVLSKDKAKGYAVYYLKNVSQGQTVKLIRLSGLTESAKYRVYGGGFDVTSYGDALMNVGLQFPKVKRDFYSIFFEIERIS